MTAFGYGAQLRKVNSVIEALKLSSEAITFCPSVTRSTAGGTLGEGDGAIWTLQEFTQIAGKPWYALQRHSDAGVERQYTGYEHEMTALCRKLRITPERLPRTSEEEFLQRATEQQWEGPSPAEGRMR